MLAYASAPCTCFGLGCRGASRRAAPARARFSIGSRSSSRRGASACAVSVDHAAHNQMLADMFGTRDMVKQLLDPLPQDIEQVLRGPMYMHAGDYHTRQRMLFLDLSHYLFMLHLISVITLCAPTEACKRGSLGLSHPSAYLPIKHPGDQLGCGHALIM